MRALGLLLVLAALVLLVLWNQHSPYRTDAAACMQTAGIPAFPAEDHVFGPQRRAFDRCMADKGWSEMWRR